MKTDEQKKGVLSKFMILCWAAFIAILGRGLGTPGRPVSGLRDGSLFGGGSCLNGIKTQ